MSDRVNSPVMLLELIIHHQPATDTSFIQLEIRHTQIFFAEQMSQSTGINAVAYKHPCNLLSVDWRVVLTSTGFDHCEFDVTVCV